MSTQIRIDLDVKAKLEAYRDRRHAKTHSDAIQYLLDAEARLTSELNDSSNKYQIEKSRQQTEDVTLGRDRRNQVLILQRDLGLTSLQDTVDVLLYHWQQSPSITKETLLYVRTLTK